MTILGYGTGRGGTVGAGRHRRRPSVGKALSLSSVLVRATSRSDLAPTHMASCVTCLTAGDSSTFGRIEPIHLDAKMHMVEVAALVVFL